MVKKYLTMKNLPFQEVDVTNDMETRTRLQQATGMTTVPVTTNGEEYVVGFKPGLLAKFAL
jgi:glutaredoxin